MDESQFDMYLLHWVWTADEETTPFAITGILQSCWRWVPRYLSDDQRMEFTELIFRIFNGLKKKLDSWDPQWQAMNQVFTILLLKQHKLEYSGNTPPLHPPPKKNSKHDILLEKLQHLHSRMQKESTTLNSRLGLQQSMRTRTAASCDDCVTLFAGRGLDICREVWPNSTTM